MKDDLTKFEKELLTTINFLNGTKYNHKNFMEWSSSRDVIEKNLQQGEVMYEASGIFVAIKTEAK